MRTGSFFPEVKRCVGGGAAFPRIGASRAIAQGIASLGPAFGVPKWGTRWLDIAVIRAPQTAS